MSTLIIALHVVAAIAVAALFALLSLAAFIDPRDPALQPAPAAPSRRAARPHARPRIHLYPRVPAPTPVSEAVSQPAPRRLHMHTQTGIRWLSLFFLTLLLGSALVFTVRPAQAAENSPTAIVSTGSLNVRTGPGVSYTVVTRIDEGESVALLARNQAATWVRVRLSGGIEGWVNASYIRASIHLADLPVSSTTAPSPAPATGVVTAARLEMRSGPQLQNGVVAVLGQGQALTLLGRTSDSAWIKVRADNLGEGWIPAQVVVRLPGDENGTATPTLTASVTLSSLPVANSAAAPSSPRVSLSGTNLRPATPVFINVTGFPANRDIAAVLTSRNVPVGFVVANGRTDASGNAQLFFRMPDLWPGGTAISESSLSLAVGTTDGAVLIWNGLAYRP